MLFRFLAGVICLLGGGVAVGMTYVAWKGGVHALRAQDVLLLPGLLWFMRLALYAAARGVTPSEGHWPFASSSVVSWYWLIYLCVSWAGP
jgi:hypothetical protein